MLHRLSSSTVFLLSVLKSGAKKRKEPEPVQPVVFPKSTGFAATVFHLLPDSMCSAELGGAFCGKKIKKEDWLKVSFCCRELLLKRFMDCPID